MIGSKFSLVDLFKMNVCKQIIGTSGFDSFASSITSMS